MKKFIFLFLLFFISLNCFSQIDKRLITNDSLKAGDSTFSQLIQGKSDYVVVYIKSYGTAASQDTVKFYSVSKYNDTALISMKYITPYSSSLYVSDFWTGVNGTVYKILIMDPVIDTFFIKLVNVSKTDRKIKLVTILNLK